jgi:hypothetical protein
MQTIFLVQVISAPPWTRELQPETEIHLNAHNSRYTPTTARQTMRSVDQQAKVKSGKPGEADALVVLRVDVAVVVQQFAGAGAECFDL